MPAVLDLLITHQTGGIHFEPTRAPTTEAGETGGAHETIADEMTQPRHNTNREPEARRTDSSKETRPLTDTDADVCLRMSADPRGERAIRASPGFTNELRDPRARLEIAPLLRSLALGLSPAGAASPPGSER